MQKQQPFDVRSALLFNVYSFLWLLHEFISISYTSRPVNDFKLNQRDVGMSSIQAYTKHTNKKAL